MWKHKVQLVNGKKIEWLTQEQILNFSFAENAPFLSVIDQNRQKQWTVPFSSIVMIESEKINED